MPRGQTAGSVTFDWAKCTSQASVNAFAFLEGNDSPASGDEVYQAFEGGLNCVEVFVDVGMVEFHRGEDDGVWKIVEKLGALVEEGGVVLAAFEDEILSIS